MNESQNLLIKIRKYEFALYELNLYLDTHPNCKDALDLYGKYKKLMTEAEKEYISKFGSIPTTAVKSYAGQDRWQWIDGPWPWERS